MPRSPLILLALGVLAATPASAQEPRAFGLKLGATWSGIQTELPSEDPEHRNGFSGFVFGEWGGPGPTALVVEAGYAERGYSRLVHASPGAGPDDVIYEHRLDKPFQYVSVAALARLDLAQAAGVGAYVMAGPRMNALVGNHRGEDVPGYDYRPMVWDASVGIGAESRRLLAEVRYNAGLNDALSGDGWGDPAYHRAVDVVIGVRF